MSLEFIVCLGNTQKITAPDERLALTFADQRIAVAASLVIKYLPSQSDTRIVNIMITFNVT